MGQEEAMETVKNGGFQPCPQKATHAQQQPLLARWE